jgi:hypothetical protein
LFEQEDGTHKAKLIVENRGTLWPGCKKKVLTNSYAITVGFFFLSQPERKVLNSKIETKHYKDFLWIMTVKTPLKTDPFVNLSLKSSPEQKLYRFEN